MRGLLGLVGMLGLLITVGIIFYLWTENTSAISKASKQARQQANQIAGRNSAGVQAGSLVTFVPVEHNGNLAGITIKSIDPTDGLAEYFGLVPNDTIVRIGPFTMGDTTLSDVESARDWVVEAMQRKMDIVVNRGGTEITLPRQRGFIPPAAGAPPAAAPATPAEAAQ